MIAQDAVDVIVFARDSGFAGQRIRSLNKVIELRSLGISLPVAEIYRDTGLGPVYIHVVQRTMATALIIAAKHLSVFS